MQELSDCTYIETWSQFINKHFIIETVKLVLALFPGKIIGHIMFQTEMFSNRGRHILVLVYKLMQMPLRVTNITCITQVTFKLINKGLLVDNRPLDFARFQMLFDFVANKRGSDGHLK